MATIFQNSTLNLNYMSVDCPLSIIHLEFCCKIAVCFNVDAIVFAAKTFHQHWHDIVSTLYVGKSLDI